NWLLIKERDEHVKLAAEIAAAFDMLVALLDEEPVLALAFRLEPNQHPAALHPLAMEDHLELPLGHGSHGIPVCGLPRPLVPQHHRAAAILALGDGAFEGGVVERMILGAHRETLHRRIGARRLGHRPALEHALHLDAEIIMLATRPMMLHDETAGALYSALRRPARRRFAGLGEIALAPIGLEFRAPLGHQPCATPGVASKFLKKKKDGGCSSGRKERLSSWRREFVAGHHLCR